jgi:hypothetical protein
LSGSQLIRENHASLRWFFAIDEFEVGDLRDLESVSSTKTLWLNENRFVGRMLFRLKVHVFEGAGNFNAAFKDFFLPQRLQLRVWQREKNRIGMRSLSFGLPQLQVQTRP